MNYRPRDGIVLLPVCDTFLLVPTRAAFESCNGIMQLSMLDALFWRRLSQGETIQELCKIYAGFFFKQPEDVRPKVEKRLERLYEKGFLVKTEEDA